MKSARYLLTLATTVLLTVSASAGIKSERVLAKIFTHTPAAKLVDAGREMAEAEKLAATLPNAKAYWGVGQSMQPLYTANTAIVVQEIDYDDIKRGMTVVYKSGRGNVVAHPVVDETKGGFIMQGINNDREDADLLTQGNFIGVVVKAYASADNELRTELVAKLAAKGRIRPSALVAQI